MRFERLKDSFPLKSRNKLQKTLCQNKFKLSYNQCVSLFLSLGNIKS